MKPWWADPDLLKAIIPAVGTVVAAVIVAVAGTLLSRFFARQRDKQDKEAQWRDHAIELAKLDLQRKLESSVPANPPKQVRPSILDFLANYRDLKELDTLSPKELYLKIEEKRMIRKAPDKEQTARSDPPANV